ncbi:MAG: hypothetical protein ACFFD2_27725 [Promethearchaeota archaeon]
MFIVCFVDFKNVRIPDEIANDSQFKNTIIIYAKKELETLRQIDDIIKELLRSDDFDFQKDLVIYAIQFLEKLDSFNLEYGERSFLINKKNIEKLIQGFRILYMTECTIYLPILSAPKWVKGLVREKNIELQILAPGFTLENEKFHLDVIEFNSDLQEPLKKIANSRLLILYILFSQIN